MNKNDYLQALNLNLNLQIAITYLYDISQLL